MTATTETTETTETTADEYMAQALAALDLLPVIYRDLDGRTAIESTGGGYGERVTGGERDYVPVNTTVLDLQRDIIDITASWAEALATDLLGKVVRDRRLSTSVEVLRDNWDVVRAADWALDAAEELLGLVDRARRYTNRRLHQIAPSDRIGAGLADTEQVARLLGVTPARVRQLVTAGQLTVAERGAHGRSYYAVTQVRALVEARGQANMRAA